MISIAIRLEMSGHLVLGDPTGVHDHIARYLSGGRQAGA
jgi:hypothetical protein